MAQQPIENLRKVRLEKLRKLRELGINPYPASWDLAEKRIKTAECPNLNLGSGVAVAGRIRAWREHGGIIFTDLNDATGKIQICFRRESLNSTDTLNFETLPLLDVGDFVGVSGELFQTKAGELTVLVKKYQLLTKSLCPLPSFWYGLRDIEERYRKRYLDLLMNPKVREVFATRTKVLRLFRQYLDEHGFVEVETPILQSIYGGAAARPFITHLNALDTDFYLRISNELYLKRLIVGGFEKVYEVSKDFRNEGMDRQHSPEFTQIEFYWAYADYENLMKFTEEILSFVIKELKGDLKFEFEGKILDFTPPLARVTYRDLILKHTGINIDEVNTEEALLATISEKKLKVDLSGVVGYGAILDALYKEFCRLKVIQPIFLIDHPAELMPLAKRKAKDPSKIESIQLLAVGYELLKAYSELNDPLDQKKRWLEQEGLAKKGLEEYEILDEDYIVALEYGMPPTAGWGMGIDRFTAILANQHTIRDVILFPLMRPEKPAVRTIDSQAMSSDVKTKADETLLIIGERVREHFPKMKVGVAIIEGVHVRKEAEELEDYKKQILDGVRDLQVEEIGKIPNIRAYRECFHAFGVDFHSRRPSPEALLRRVAAGRGLYKVNNAVDAYNLAVLQTKVGLGAFDLDKINLPKVLRFAREGEEITLLGESETTFIHEGELIYADQEGPVTLDLNYRDCDRAKITTQTKSVLLVADGCPGISREKVEEALNLGCELITRFAGGQIVKKFIVT